MSEVLTEKSFSLWLVADVYYVYNTVFVKLSQYNPTTSTNVGILFINDTFVHVVDVYISTFQHFKLCSATCWPISKVLLSWLFGCFCTKEGTLISQILFSFRYIDDILSFNDLRHPYSSFIVVMINSRILMVSIRNMGTDPITML